MDLEQKIIVEYVEFKNYLNKGRKKTFVSRLMLFFKNKLKLKIGFS